MRRIEERNKFKKDIRRELKSPDNRDLLKRLNFTVNLLRNDFELPKKFVDHSMQGKYIGMRNCHIKPDLILLYRKINTDVLILERIGSHSELGF